MGVKESNYPGTARSQHRHKVQEEDFMPQLKPPPSIEVNSHTEEAVLKKLQKITKLLEETKK
jgi:hypothetical protein